MEQESLIKVFFEWLKKAPNWSKVVVMVLAAAVAAIYLCTSCSTIARVQLDKRTTREVKDTTHLILSTIRERTTYKRVGAADPFVIVTEKSIRSDASSYLTVKAKP